MVISDWHGNDTDFVGGTLGILGTIAAFLMYLSPTPTMLKVTAERCKSAICTFTNLWRMIYYVKFLLIIHGDYFALYVLFFVLLFRPRLLIRIVWFCICLLLFIFRDVSGFSEIPYAVALLNAAIWVCYAASTPGRLAAFVCNMLGLVLEVQASLLYHLYF